MIYYQSALTAIHHIETKEKTSTLPVEFEYVPAGQILQLSKPEAPDNQNCHDRS
jgi:hypothetical protein